MPHFLAIAWMYREDYARRGLRDAAGHAILMGDITGRQSFLVFALPARW